jgi:lipid II:glycine glycyltransferase (peptidoglycan interpeptide bridge formation enzyme)
MDFLDSAEWSKLLQESFGGYALRSTVDAAGSRSLGWFVFRLGPLGIAYPRFPVGLHDEDIASFPELHAHLAQLRSRGVDVAQISVTGDPGICASAGYHSVDLPDTTIHDLQDWSDAALTPSCRTKVRRAARHGLRVEDAGPADASELSGLYRQSLARHGGAARYPQRYFESLAREATRNAAVRIGIARTTTNEAVGFIATVIHGHRTSYLHGGFDQSATRLRPGYACMHWAIREAQRAGSTEFRMLTSPLKQPALVDYKESFGGKTRIRRHFSVPTSLLGHAGALALAWNARRRQR